jgi:hypothetical protein
MKWVLAALVLGIFLNGSSIGGEPWPIGSVVAVVIMGIYIKTSLDRHFEELKNLLKEDVLQNTADNPVNDECTHIEQ